LHDGSIDQMRAAKASGNNRPIFHPADAMFHPDTNTATLKI
jgi:hypothetical protein